MPSAASSSGRSADRYLVVTSRFNARVTERLAAAARATLERHGIAPERIVDAAVPGAWELPPVVAKALRCGDFRAVIACGAVIRGETAHFDQVARAAIDGLARVQLESRIPVGLAVLTTDTLEQALARAGGKAGNKGEEAALAVLETADILERMSAQDA